MVKSSTHQEVLDETVKELEAEGWRVVRLAGKSPDAVASKDNKIIAVTVLSQRWKDGKGWKKGWTYREKLQTYEMFDDVVIKCFLRIPDETGPDICEYDHCEETDTITEIIHGLPLTLCTHHMELYKAADASDRTEHVYWTFGHLKHSASTKWYRRRV